MVDERGPAQADVEGFLADAPAALRGWLAILPGPVFRLHRNGTVTGAYTGVDAELVPGVREEIDALKPNLPVPLEQLLPADVSEQIRATVHTALATGTLQELVYPQVLNGRLRSIRARCASCGPDEVLWLTEDLSAREDARDARRARREYETAASRRIVFESRLAECSQRLLTASHEDLDEQVQACLRSMAEHFGADVAFICSFGSPGVLELVAQWRGPNAPDPIERSGRVRPGEFRYGEVQLARDPVLLVRDPTALSKAGGEERALMQRLRNQSFAWIRIGPPGDQAGLFGLSWKSQRYEGEAEPLRGLVRLGEAILSARTRRDAEMLVIGQRRVLELVASGASLGNSLSEVARLREGGRPSLRCAVLLADPTARGDSPVVVGAAPSFPDEAEALVRGLDLSAFPVADGDDCPGSAHAVDELPAGPLADRLRAVGAVTVGVVPLMSVETGRQAGLLLNLDLDPDRKPLLDREIDEACAALASVAIERAAAVAALTHQATHDPLTSVANRPSLLDRLEVALLRARTHHGLVAVLFCDLDRFKEINDLFGHPAGDEVLREVTRRISRAVAPTDTVARFGGDEFVVLIEDLRDEEEVLVVADRVSQAVMEPPLVVQGTPVRLTVSIGVAISAGGMDHPEALVRDADVAMYGAKSGGRARLEVFRAGIRRAAHDRDQLARDLAHAIENGEMAVYYQPVLGIEDGRVRGVEALLRWHHPERGAISPEVFVPIAEETGLIVPLGRWVTSEALEQLHVLAGLHPQWAGLRGHVNVSARQLAERGFVEDLRAALDRWDVPAKHVAVEITETVLMADSPVTAVAIGDLVDLGVELVLDDFGTGYASLTYLRRFPVRGLKIDRTFVAGLGQRAEDDAVVRAVVDLAHSLDLDLVAEGVETSTQLEFLRERRCQMAQGYFFSPAVPKEQLPAVLERLGGR